MTNLRLYAALCSAALLATAGSASAADMYRKAPPATPIIAAASVYNWTGFYAGASLGGEWLSNTLNIAGRPSQTVMPGSLFGGVQAGYNYQTGAWVLGVEGDIGYAHPRKITRSGDVSVSTQGSIRARAGYAFDNFLVYGTGGLALADMKIVDFVDVPNKTKSGVRAGWVVGGGVEYAINRSFTVRGEYLYSNYGNIDTGTADRDEATHLVRVGVNYRF